MVTQQWLQNAYRGLSYARSTFIVHALSFEIRQSDRKFGEDTVSPTLMKFDISTVLEKIFAPFFFFLIKV